MFHVTRDFANNLKGNTEKRARCICYHITDLRRFEDQIKGSTYILFMLHRTPVNIKILPQILPLRTCRRQHTHKPISERANFVACVKSHIQPKRSNVPNNTVFFFQSFVIYVYERHLWIMRYHRHWLREAEDWFFRVGFRFLFFFFWEPPKPILLNLYMLNFFLLYKYNKFWKKLNCSCDILLWWRISLACESYTQNDSHMRFTAHMSFCSRKGLLPY